jgi:hypothetical protein
MMFRPLSLKELSSQLVSPPSSRKTAELDLAYMKKQFFRRESNKLGGLSD